MKRHRYKILAGSPSLIIPGGHKQVCIDCGLIRINGYGGGRLIYYRNNVPQFHAGPCNPSLNK